MLCTLLALCVTNGHHKNRKEKRHLSESQIRSQSLTKQMLSFRAVVANVPWGGKLIFKQSMRPNGEVWVQSLFKPRYWRLKLLSWNGVHY